MSMSLYAYAFLFLVCLVSILLSLSHFNTRRLLGTLLTPNLPPLSLLMPLVQICNLSPFLSLK
jgi:uncharacterized protein YggT (Ycf19 family)